MSEKIRVQYDLLCCISNWEWMKFVKWRNQFMHEERASDICLILWLVAVQTYIVVIQTYVCLYGDYMSVRRIRRTDIQIAVQTYKLVVQTYKFVVQTYIPPHLSDYMSVAAFRIAEVSGGSAHVQSNARRVAYQVLHIFIRTLARSRRPSSRLRLFWGIPCVCASRMNTDKCENQVNRHKCVESETGELVNSILFILRYLIQIEYTETRCIIKSAGISRCDSYILSVWTVLYRLLHRSKYNFPLAYYSINDCFHFPCYGNCTYFCAWSFRCVKVWMTFPIFPVMESCTHFGELRWWDIVACAVRSLRHDHHSRDHPASSPLSHECRRHVFDYTVRSSMWLWHCSAVCRARLLQSTKVKVWHVYRI